MVSSKLQRRTRFPVALAVCSARFQTVHDVVTCRTKMRFSGRENGAQKTGRPLLHFYWEGTKKGPRKRVTKVNPKWFQFSVFFSTRNASSLVTKKLPIAAQLCAHTSNGSFPFRAPSLKPFVDRCWFGHKLASIVIQVSRTIDELL